MLPWYAARYLSSFGVQAGMWGSSAPRLERAPWCQGLPLGTCCGGRFQHMHLIHPATINKAQSHTIIHSSPSLDHAVQRDWVLQWTNLAGAL